MDNDIFNSPILEDTWTVACGGNRCCIEVAQLEGGGYALRNTAQRDKVIRATAEELRTFGVILPGLIDPA